MNFMTNSNWRLRPKHATVGDYKDIISANYASQYHELAYRVFDTDEPWKHSTVVEWMTDYLKKKGDWVRINDLKIDAISDGYHQAVVWSGIRRLEKTSNIGRKYDSATRAAYLIWYPETPLDTLNQSALDEYDHT
jgi:hypothetical protein